MKEAEPLKLLEVLSPEMLPMVVAVGFDAITEVLSNELVFVKARVPPSQSANAIP